jgi:hypothetical protein
MSAGPHAIRFSKTGRSLTVGLFRTRVAPAIRPIEVKLPLKERRPKLTRLEQGAHYTEPILERQ